MNWKKIVEISGYVAMAVLVGCILYGSFMFYFRKKEPNVQNFAPDSKPVFNTVNNNLERHWSIGPYIQAEFEKGDPIWVFGGRLEYRF